MSLTVQEFLARGTAKAAEDLEAALMRVPEDKRKWSAMGEARTALDQVAECAILNGSTAKLIVTRTWDMSSGMDDFYREKVELANKDTAVVITLLHENTAKAIAAIRDAPTEDLETQIEMPWGPMALHQILSYPYWNMCYHEGQINYIASMLGTL